MDLMKLKWHTVFHFSNLLKLKVVSNITCEEAAFRVRKTSVFNGQQEPFNIHCFSLAR